MDLSDTWETIMDAAGRSRRFSFWMKAAAAAALVILADRLFLFHEVGWTLGGFALAWALLVVATQPAIRRDRRAWVAIATALGLALVQVDHPSLLAWVLFCAALGTAVLLPAARFDDVFVWTQRLIRHAVLALFGPVVDLLHLRRLSRFPVAPRALQLAALLVLPLTGGAVFLTLFAAANPVISETLGRLRLPRIDFQFLARMVIWGIVFTVVWGAFRPRRSGTRELLALPESRVRALPGVTVASVTLSLVLFNAMFALQNTLDAVFLWSGAPLPEGVTLAEYAHRGAYPLIATALLAGLFVLVTLSPGSETAQRPWVRRLVVLWVVQNLFLVASTMLRTLDYIAVYSLTPMRIAALAWMTLVGVGLLLICWRMLRARSTAWLLNANALAAGLVLALASAVDLGGISAGWNVAHAREAGGRGAALDLCYLHQMGGSAVAPSGLAGGANARGGLPRAGDLCPHGAAGAVGRAAVRLASLDLARRAPARGGQGRAAAGRPGGRSPSRRRPQVRRLA
jgi:hypothetical protein